ncbi:MAG: hypothetical protein J3K34DRAFT_445207 [Monoraphidium minutum]|nr:MAG: hypothetical protein J3K34DRAFT_445207 [Monoraphidium minutum]
MRRCMATAPVCVGGPAGWRLGDLGCNRVAPGCGALPGVSACPPTPPGGGLRSRRVGCGGATTDLARRASGGPSPALKRCAAATSVCVGGPASWRPSKPGRASGALLEASAYWALCDAAASACPPTLPGGGRARSALARAGEGLISLIKTAHHPLFICLAGNCRSRPTAAHPPSDQQAALRCRAWMASDQQSVHTHACRDRRRASAAASS